MIKQRFNALVGVVWRLMIASFIAVMMLTNIGLMQDRNILIANQVEMQASINQKQAELNYAVQQLETKSRELAALQTAHSKAIKDYADAKEQLEHALIPQDSIGSAVKQNVLRPAVHAARKAKHYVADLYGDVMGH